MGNPISIGNCQRPEDWDTGNHNTWKTVAEIYWRYFFYLPSSVPNNIPIKTFPLKLTSFCVYYMTFPQAIPWNLTYIIFVQKKGVGNGTFPNSLILDVVFENLSALVSTLLSSLSPILIEYFGPKTNKKAMSTLVNWHRLWSKQFSWNPYLPTLIWQGLCIFAEG